MKALISRKYLQIAGRRIALILTLHMASCTSNVDNSYQEDNDIVMEIPFTNIVGEEKNIEASFSLAQHATSTRLDRYQLKITLTGSENELYYSYSGRALKSVPSKSISLSSLTQTNVLDTEDEALIVNFSLLPAVDVNAVSITFELLNSAGATIQQHTVSWIKNTNQSPIEFLTRPCKIVQESIETLPPTTDKQPFPDTALLPIMQEDTASKQYEAAIRENKDDAKSNKRPRVKESASASKKAKTEAIHNQQSSTEIILAQYSAMDTSKLAELANTNDALAQEEIITRYSKIKIPPLMQSLVDPFSWQGIQAKLQEDERYVYFLLHFSKQAKDHTIYREIVSSVKAYARAGNTLAQTNLGLMYKKGLGVKRDYKKAIEWYTKAANQGNIAAQNSLGYIYKEGKGVDPNYEKAIEWYTKAADQGNTVAQYNLGIIYKQEEGTVCDYQESIKWLTKAANQKNSYAQTSLGHMYYHGKGVRQDYQKAIEWYIKAANQGNRDAQDSLGYIYYNAKGVERDYEKARKWYEKAAKQGDRNSQTYLGIMYKKGQGTDKDLAHAIYWFMKARNEAELLRIFKLKSFLPLKEKIYATEMDGIEGTLLSNWQALLIQKERDRADRHATLHGEAYRQLEETMAQFIGWRHQLYTQPKLMVSCVRLRKPKYITTIENHQKETGIIPYIKQHILHNNVYSSFGKKNVVLAEAIVNELINKTLCNQTHNILKQIEETYKMAQMKAVSEAAYIEEALQMDGLTPTEEADLAKNLARANKLAAIFLQKVQSLQEEAYQFNRYCTLLPEDIQNRQYERNQRFKEKYAYLFDYKRNQMVQEDEVFDFDNEDSLLAFS
ncbi:hypothetical protein Aasi_0954 [Candidatus Amoebophilus asiaticus 5a2]|uniref:Sel1 domain protein repeat-containing protein n=1 Tax=Amoebophilus asiaticus (strain 5a2) TaxID=452471 RepID=B3ESW0_AMOA5|nr:tetratricopeptide repeat protein [Candidatus Amoebophilus asiaticus]ACE06312.1 hypothetical protein Aasi_0954 [Candidatus Amoebophilus asiaticus 5a2]